MEQWACGINHNLIQALFHLRVGLYVQVVFPDMNVTSPRGDDV